MSIAVDRIKAIMESRNMSVRELGRLTDIPQSTINRYITTQSKKIPVPALELIANVLGVSPAYLMGWDDDSVSLLKEARPISTVSLPLLGNVACGEPIFAEENVESYIDAEEGTQADFCLRVKGDSMINARIFDGDVIFVKKQDMVDNGEIAVVLIDEEATVKRVYYDRENNVITLMPENPTYKPMRYTGAELDTVRILGKVLAGQYRVI